MKLFKHTRLFLSKIKNVISRGLDDADNYLTYASSIRLHKTKKIILDFEEYRYKVVKDSYGYTTYFYHMQTISIKKYILFGPLREEVILLDAFDINMNIENVKYSKSHVASEVNFSFQAYKNRLARQSEIENGDVI